MQGEFNRRKGEATTRIAAAKKIIAQKTHSIILNEINSNIRSTTADSTPQPIIQQSLQQSKSNHFINANMSSLTFEQEYRNSLIGIQKAIPQEQQEPLLQPKCISEVDHSQYNTVDTQRRQQSIYEMDDNEILEEVSHLSEKPHPLPQKPNTSQVKINTAANYQTCSSQQQVLEKHNDIINVKTSEYSHQKKNSYSYSTQKPPQYSNYDNLYSQKLSSPLKQAAQNKNHQLPNQKKIASPYKIMPKVYYRNNFNKDSKFVEKAQKEQYQDQVKKNLKKELNELVDTFNTKDNDKVEDMILQLNRLSQKTNGSIPLQQQAKMQSYVNEIELQKMTYSQVKKSTSPNPRRQSSSTNGASPMKSKIQMGSTVKNKTINVNSEKLKEIIMQTESKVRESIRGSKTTMNSHLNSARHSMDRPFTQSAQTPQSIRSVQQFPTNEVLKLQMQQALNEMNARYLAKFLKRRGDCLQQGDYQTAYLLALIVALVDESLPLTNDKSDISFKSWEDISRQLSNHGKIIYSLQKLRVAFEKDDFNKILQKCQFLKKYEELKGLFDLNSNLALPINIFLQKIVNIFTQFKATSQKQESDCSSRNIKTNTIMNKKGLEIQSTNYQSPGQSTPKTSRQFQSSRGSPLNSSSIKTPKPTTLQGQLLQQKQMALDKTYQLQLDQSRSIQMKEESAKKKQLYVAKLKNDNNQFFARINKEDKQKLEDEIKKEENDYVKYQSEFRSRLNSIDQKHVEEEKLRIRESSLDNQEFKRALRQREKEEEIIYYKQGANKQLQELQYKQQATKQGTQLKNVQLKQKQQELFLGKVRESENFLISKEIDLDERLKSQFDKAAYRFKELQDQEEFLKEQRRALLQISARQSKR